MRMIYIKPFDPWKSKLCTCPFKYSLNIYTGCDHCCIYCYSSAYIKDFFRIRKKKNFLAIVSKDLEKLPENSLLSLSNTSDPYPRLEKRLGLTRKFLELLLNKNIRLLIITKSDLLLRDLDLISKLRVAVTFTITSFRLDKKLEPNAPSSASRLKAMKVLADHNIKVGLRLDPVIPYINENEIEHIIESCSDFINHVVTSTFKPRRDSWQRFSLAFPKEAKKLSNLYFKEGKYIGNSWYLPENLRKALILKVKEVSSYYGIPFSSCREGFPELNTAKSCDGSWMIP